MAVLYITQHVINSLGSYEDVYPKTSSVQVVRENNPSNTVEELLQNIEKYAVRVVDTPSDSVFGVSIATAISQIPTVEFETIFANEAFVRNLNANIGKIGKIYAINDDSNSWIDMDSGTFYFGNNSNNISWDNNNLNINGSGSFSGKIVASSGEIGGATISNGVLQIGSTNITKNSITTEHISAETATTLVSTSLQTSAVSSIVTNLVAENLTVSDLKAGDIVLLDKMRILTQSDATKGIVLSGSEMQFLDADGNPAISIGYNTTTTTDEEGNTVVSVDYSSPAIIIKDADGAVILNSSGLSSTDVGLTAQIQTKSINANQLAFEIKKTDSGTLIIQNYDGTDNVWGKELTEFTTEINESITNTQSNLTQIAAKDNYGNWYITDSILQNTYVEDDDNNKHSIQSLASEISQNAKDILLKVSESDLDGTYLVSKINIAPEGVKISAEHVNIDGAVTFSSLNSSVQELINNKASMADIVIGGRNLILKPIDENSFGSTSYQQTISFTGNTFAPISKNIKLAVGDVYIGKCLISYESSSVDGAKISLGASSMHSALGSFILGNSTIGSIYYSEDTSLSVGESKWIEFKYVIENLSDGLSFFLANEDPSNIAQVTFRYAKLEKGNIASDWTIAPEDTANEIEDAVSEVTDNIYTENTTTIDGGKITTNTITANQIKANTITTAQLATDAIKSLNYTPTLVGDTQYTKTGSFFNLENGVIETPNFAITEDGSAYVRGEIIANSGTIGGCTIENGVLKVASANIISIDASQATITNLNADNITSGALMISDDNDKIIFKASKDDKQVQIGGFYVDNGSIHTANVLITSNVDNSIGLSSVDFARIINGTQRNGLRFAIGDKFGITGDGTLYVSNATISGDITATSLTLESGVTISTGNIDGINNYATIDSLDDYIKSDDFNISKSANSTTGIVTETITYNGNTYTIYTSDASRYILTDIGYGSQDDGKTYAKISKDGLLTANNAVVKGKIYATEGQIGGCSITNGVLYISEANISGTINADKINATDLSAISADLGTITAGTIEASTVTINDLNASNITSGTLSADRLNIENLSAISADLGTITAGTIAGGIITTNKNRTTYNNTLYTGITMTSDGLGGYTSKTEYFNMVKGKLTAIGVDVKGAITATSGTFGCKSGAYIEMSSNKFTMYDNDTEDAFSITVNSTGSDTVYSASTDDDIEGETVQTASTTSTSLVVVEGSSMPIKVIGNIDIVGVSNSSSVIGNVTAAGVVSGKYLISTGGFKAANAKFKIGGTYGNFSASGGNFKVNSSGNITKCGTISCNSATASGTILCSTVSINNIEGSGGGYIAFKNSFHPNSDSTLSVGTSSSQFKQVYCVALHESSDKKIKNHISYLKDESSIEDFIYGLRPVMFTFKNGDTGRHHMGFYAQDVADLSKTTIGDNSIYSATVKKNYEEDNETYNYYDPNEPDENLIWTLTYKDFIAPIVTVIQKQHNEIDELKTILQSAMERISTLEAELTK